MTRRRPSACRHPVVQEGSLAHSDGLPPGFDIHFTDCPFYTADEDGGNGYGGKVQKSNGRVPGGNSQD
jgi:hypothetical protein